MSVDLKAALPHDPALALVTDLLDEMEEAHQMATDAVKMWRDAAVIWRDAAVIWRERYERMRASSIVLGVALATSFFWGLYCTR